MPLPPSLTAVIQTTLKWAFANLFLLIFCQKSQAAHDRFQHLCSEFKIHTTLMLLMLFYCWRCFSNTISDALTKYSHTYNPNSILSGEIQQIFIAFPQPWHTQETKSFQLTLSVTLGKLDFNLPATNPLPVQAVKSVFGITHILKYAGWLRVLFALFFGKATHISMDVFPQINKNTPSHMNIQWTFCFKSSIQFLCCEQHFYSKYIFYMH